MHNIKKIGLFALLFIGSCSIAIAQDSNTEEIDGYTIIPELSKEEITDMNEKVTEVGETAGKVWENYNQAAEELSTAQQINTGIMNWDTILDYIVFIVRFLNQIGLVVGMGFIMYAGVKYMISVFSDKQAPSSDLIKNAILGIVIIIFSYAIMKALTSVVGLS